MPILFPDVSFSLYGLEFLSAFFLYFSLLSILGWFIEMCYLASAGRGLINSGFLQGPFCPAYAAGACIIYPFTILFASQPIWLQLILYVILATVIEYMAHFILEKILGIRIWDYSDEFMNLHGRISIKYAFFWFLLVMVLAVVLQPLGVALVQALPRGFRYMLAAIFFVIFVVDILLSTSIFNKYLKIIQELSAAFGLPVQEMQDLQFNRPRIMTGKKRLEKLFADPAYRELDSRIGEKLLCGVVPDGMGFDPADYKDIIDHPAYAEWRKSSALAEGVYNTALRTAELSWKFVKTLGLDARGAARGMLLAAYLGDVPLKQPLSEYFCPRVRTLRAVRRDIFKPGRIEKDVILRHKWPINLAAPHSQECLAASFAEKLVVSRDSRNALGILYRALLE